MGKASKRIEINGKGSGAATGLEKTLIKLTVDGLDGMAAEQTFPVKVTGTVGLPPGSRRLVESSDR